MPILASDLVKRKKEQVFAEGYFINCASDATGAVAATEDVIHIYGQDDPLLDMRVDNGTLSLTVYDKADNNNLLDATTQKDPDFSATENRRYKWDDVKETTVWINRKNMANDKYERSTFYKNWIPVPGMPTGAPETRNTRVFAGNCEIPKEYNQPILGEKLALTSGANGYTATLAKETPLKIPDAANIYALRVVAIYEVRAGNEITTFNKEDLDITTSMVSSAGAISLTQSDLDEVTWPNAVYVNYLYDDDEGVYPTVKPHGFYKKLSLIY